MAKYRITYIDSSLLNTPYEDVYAVNERQAIRRFRMNHQEPILAIAKL